MERFKGYAGRTGKHLSTTGTKIRLWVNIFWNLPSNGDNGRTKLNDLRRELRRCTTAPLCEIHNPLSRRARARRWRDKASRTPYPRTKPTATPIRNSIFSILRGQKKGPGDGETWPKATAYRGSFRGRGLDDVWSGFSVAAFKKDKRL
jgi:hypothetical protein